MFLSIFQQGNSLNLFCKYLFYSFCISLGSIFLLFLVLDLFLFLLLIDFFLGLGVVFRVSSVGTKGVSQVTY